MKLGFSCAIDGREPYHFAQLALHIHTATLGEGWDTLGTMVLCLQNALANLTALQRATHTTPLNAITPARASLAQYYDTPHAVLPYGTSTFDGECLLLFKYQHCAHDVHQHRYAAICQAYAQPAFVIRDFPFQAYYDLLHQLANRLNNIRQPLGGRLLIYAPQKAA